MAKIMVNIDNHSSVNITTCGELISLSTKSALADRTTYHTAGTGFVDMINNKKN